MIALWRNFERHQEVQPTAPAPEVQAILSGLEKEVASLKTLFQAQDEEIANRDSIISEERSTNSRLKKEVLEANEWCNRSVEGMSRELNRVDQLESQLRAVQNECSKACKNVEAAEAEKGKLEAEKNKALKAQEHSESLLIRLRVRYDQCMAKRKHYLKQLSYVPYLRDQS
jgi:chromosome segregation ATPase